MNIKQLLDEAEFVLQNYAYPLRYYRLKGKLPPTLYKRKAEFDHRYTDYLFKIIPSLKACLLPSPSFACSLAKSGFKGILSLSDILQIQVFI